MIVTGSRLPKSTDKIPGAVNVISELEVARSMMLSTDVTALLTRTVPGYAESKQQLSNTGETLRGRISLRLFDGVPQGSPLREVNRSGVFTDLGIIQRVEVINGPSAAEGVGASGGIINYISRTPAVDGTVVQLSTQARTQFENDSESWRIGFNIAHKEDAYDALFATSFAETGIPYDGHGRRIGLDPSGSGSDSESGNLFIKLGKDFGLNDSQRLELAISRFKIECQCNYTLEVGDPDSGITNTVIKKQPLGSKASFNDFTQETLKYTNTELGGGALWIQYYNASQGMRFEAENFIDKQDPLIVPIPLGPDGLPAGDFPPGGFPLVEQSEMNTQKEGLRSAYTRPDLFVDDFEVQVGLDLVEDIAQQKLALTDRIWVPPMEYTSVAPFLQLSYDIGPLTLTAGVRREDGELQVDDYTTVWNRDRRFVSGGTLKYEETMPNIGAIWRVNEQWSVYASFSEGFTLPNVGIPLRNISCSNDTNEDGSDGPFGGTEPDGCPNDPPISVEGILDLQAIIVENREIGFNWRGSRGNFGASYYQSDSDLGVSLAVDPNTNDFIMLRRPTEIEGFEFSGEFNVTDQVRLNALFSHTEGDTRSGDIGPLDREMGINDIGPDKLVLTANWAYADLGDVTIGSRTLLDRDINEGGPGEEHINGYTLFDLTANYRLGDGTLSLGIDNLTDKFYILSQSQVPGFQNYFSGRGRVFTLGYFITFL
ncbi:MAG: TonB-dependent receptor [Woeseiaceae bacterium]